MKKSKTINFEKLKKDKLIPFGILFIFMLLLHQFTTIFGDDLFFSGALDNQNLFQYFNVRYNTWTSRLIIETFLVFFSRININFWRIVDTLLYVLSAYIISLLINNKKNIKIDYFICLLFLMYPFFDQSSAGWIATTTNYVWSFALGLVSFLPLILKEQNKKVNIFIYIISLLSLLYAANQEQMCAVILGFNILYLLYCLIKKKKLNTYNIICLLISISMLTFILTCPGNKVRALGEIKTWYPDYASYGIKPKIYLGIVPTMNILLSNQLFLEILVIMLTYATFVYSKKHISKIISICSLTLTSLLTIFKESLIGFFPNCKYIFDIFNYQTLPSFSDKTSYVPLVISILLVGTIVYMILVIFREKKLLPLFIFLAGIASRFIMGFSPTIFASVSRTAYFMYMAIIAVIIFITYKLYNDKKITKNIESILFGVLIIISLLNYINILVNM